MMTQQCASVWTGELWTEKLCSDPANAARALQSKTVKRSRVVCCFSMIDEEMEEFEPDDYTSSLPPIPLPSFPEGSVLAQEYQRVASDPASRLSAFDGTRYQVKPPRSVQRMPGGVVS